MFVICHLFPEILDEVPEKFSKRSNLLMRNFPRVSDATFARVPRPRDYVKKTTRRPNLPDAVFPTSNSLTLQFS